VTLFTVFEPPAGFEKVGEERAQSEMRRKNTLTRVRDLILSNHNIPILQACAQRAPVKCHVNNRQHLGARGDSRNTAEQENSSLQRSKKQSGTREKEVPNTAIGVIKPLLGPHQHLRVEMHQKRWQKGTENEID